MPYPHKPNLIYMAQIFLLAIVYMSFISIGLPDGILGVAWPAMREEMQQPLAAVGAITLTMTACAASAGFMAGGLIRRLGTGVIVAASCLMTGTGLLVFSMAPNFYWCVAMAVPLGLGAGVVDAALNHFVASHYSSRHMNWLHGFWGVGASTGPLVMGAAMAGSGGWHLGVKAISLAQLTLAAVLWLSLRLWSQAPPHNPDAQAHEPVQAHSVHPLAWWLAPFGFLIYVAAEMGTGLWAASILVNDRGLPPPDAGLWVGLYFGSITAGRFGVGLIAEHLGNRRLVRLGAAFALVGALIFALPMVFGVLSPWGLMLMGLGCAPIFPSMMHETTRRFPTDAATRVIGRQMACAYVGGSVVPAAFGLLATWFGLGAVMPAVVCLLALLLLLTAALDQIS